MINHSFTAVDYVVPCFIKISRIPRIGDILPGSVSIIEQELYLVQGIAARDPLNISDICMVHTDDQSVSAALLGDADNNGTVDSVDALLILRYALRILDSLSSMDNADVTGDGEVDSVDALMVLRYALGIITL